MYEKITDCNINLLFNVQTTLRGTMLTGTSPSVTWWLGTLAQFLENLRSNGTPSQSNCQKIHNTKYCVDKKNQLDVTFYILYFSTNSCSTCFGQPRAHHQELTTA